MAYTQNELIRIVEDSDTISTDAYKAWCDGQTEVTYTKRDYIFRSGVWRETAIPALVSPKVKPGQVLVVGHSDLQLTRIQSVILRLRGYRRIFGTNSSPLPGVTECLPLGLTNDSDDSPRHRVLGNTELLLLALRQQREPTFVNQILLSFNPNTAPRFRQHLYETFAGSPEVNVVNLDYTLKGRLSYLLAIRNHEFVLCPRGNGKDTHRLWESLYMGSTPVVKRGEIERDLMDRYPVWVVEDWAEVHSVERRKLAREHIARKAWDSRLLRQSYWNAKIVGQTELEKLERCSKATKVRHLEP